MRKSKFDSKSCKGIIVGYEPNGYKVWVVELGKFVVARDVIFEEISAQKSRPTAKISENFRNHPVCETGGENPLCEAGIWKHGTGTQEEKRSDENTGSEGENPLCGTQEEKRSDENTDSEGENPLCGTQEEKRSDENADSLSASGDNVIENADPSKLGVTARVVADEHNNRKLSQKRLSQLSLLKSKRLKELPKISYEKSNIDKYLLSAESFVNSVPTSYEEIETRHDSSCWKKAVQDELNSHKINNTWTIVDKPMNKNFVDSRCVFTIKYDECGNLLKYKDRLVARGFTQEYLL